MISIKGWKKKTQNECKKKPAKSLLYKKTAFFQEWVLHFYVLVGISKKIKYFKIQKWKSKCAYNIP
jgi:hypothetical protein